MVRVREGAPLAVMPEGIDSAIAPCGRGDRRDHDGLHPERLTYDVVLDAVGKHSFRRCRVLMPLPRYIQRDVLLLKELVESDQFRPVIDRRYSFDEVVEATRYVETGQKTGNVILQVRPPSVD